MSYSNSFPTQTPSLNLNFATGSDQFLDSRISYSRSSTGTAFSSEKHLSSENLLPYSNDLSNSAWFSEYVSVASAAITAPDSSSTASDLRETAHTGLHTFNDQYTSVAGVSYTHTVFAKANGRTAFTLYTRDANATFDLSASTVVNNGMDSVSITAIGSTGWYKCVATQTATNTLGILQVVLLNSGAASYLGETDKGIYFWGMQASSLGEQILNPTSGSIHRSFAPTLKSYSSDQPRFEFDPASDGQSEGLLIESQATNLARYSSDISSWNSTSTVELTSNAGIAPNGQLEADLIVFPSTATQHYVYDNTISMTSGTTYTTSVYVKSAGQRYFQLCGNSAGFGYTGANFDLQAVSSVNINSTTSTITAIGSGWYRLTVTMAAAATTTGGVILIGVGSSTAAHFAATAGNDFDGVLCWGFQTEVGSSASSMISTSGAAATKSADSCSVDLSGTSFRGGPASIVIETPAGAGEGFIPYLFSLTGGDQNFYAFKNTTTATATDDWRYQVGGTGTTVSGSAGSDKIAIRWDTGDVKAQFSAGVSSTNSGAVETAFTNLKIGSNPANLYQLNGNFKRLSLYSVALSDTELATLVD